jgi:hypothetical protein
VTGAGYALWANVHGHLAVLGLAVLLHPVVTLVRRKAATPWTRRTAWLGAAMLTVPFAIGWWLYPTYRQRVKPALYAAHDPGSAAALKAFESKEHLAAMAVVLAVSGAVALHAAGRTPEGRRTAGALLLASWLCGVVAAALGLFVTARAQPGW